MDLAGFTLLRGARRGGAQHRHTPVRTGSVLLPDLLLLLVGLLNRDHRDGLADEQLARYASDRGVVTRYWGRARGARYWLAWTPAWSGYAAALAHAPEDGWCIDLRPTLPAPVQQPC